VKNTDCVIYITTKRGLTWSYLKENNGWTQTGPTGIVCQRPFRSPHFRPDFFPTPSALS
jgi:hypothetical protein